MAGSELQPGMLLGTSYPLSPPHTQLLLFFLTVWLSSRRPELPPAPRSWRWLLFSPFAPREWLCSSVLKGLEFRGCSKGWGTEIGFAGSSHSPAQVLGTQRAIVGWGWCRGTGTKDGPAVLQCCRYLLGRYFVYARRRGQ